MYQDWGRVISFHHANNDNSTHFQDDPEEVAAPQVESVRSSDIDFIDTEEEDSVGPRGSMDDFDGSENSEVKKNIF